MNHALLSAGHPWVTVRSDERLPFFRAIETAQVDGDATAFTEFLWHLIRQAAKEMQSKATRTGRRKR